MPPFSLSTPTPGFYATRMLNCRLSEKCFICRPRWPDIHIAEGLNLRIIQQNKTVEREHCLWNDAVVDRVH